MRALHFTTCWIAALVAGSDAVSAPCGYSANAMIASTSGTITTASASDTSRDSTPVAGCRLCMVRMNIRSM